ncbi:e9imm peptide [Alkalihalobacillus sp. 1P02AB]|uniref:e9imm peptide n=1 Tax=Alkalihalobacillus sp. 1P02AB TaxID=3132260 RepID=UPI0039A40195
MSRRINKKQILKLAKEIGYRQKAAQPYEDLMKEFQTKVPYPNAEVLFLTDNTPENIVKRAMSYKQIKSGELSRTELIELVEKIINNLSVGEHQMDFWIETLTEAVLDPKITDYIFWEDGLTSEEIVDKALAYKPIKL